MCFWCKFTRRCHYVPDVICFASVYHKDKKLDTSCVLGKTRKTVPPQQVDAWPRYGSYENIDVECFSQGHDV